MEANNKELTDEEDGNKVELQRLTSVTSERPIRAVSPSAQEELLTAIKNNSVGDVKRLLPEVDLEYTYGYPDFGSCLYIAAKEGSVDVAKMLIEHKAYVNRYNDKRKNTPLHIASELGHSDMVKLLIDGGGKLKNGRFYGNLLTFEPLYLSNE
ncbi:ankyrin-1-like [Ischnura elegans]|uniref:ankyrin-1-like n=1 Tax=Ischnura elegans TaxID=197161 RepID=UPI001ED8BA05|nr:ankyrin-1-like [Ischnura elegans]